MKSSNRILRVLKDSGPRKTAILRGLCPSQAEFERAVGKLFLAGSVRWAGRTSGRLLAAKSGT